MPSRANVLAPCVTHHRQVRAHPLGVAEGVQELAAELDRAPPWPCAARGRRGIAEQLHLAAVAVGERACARRPRVTRAVVADRADARLVDLERVGVRDSGAAVVAFDLRCAARRRCRSAGPTKSRIDVVGLVARRRRGARRRRRRRVAHQPPGAQRQQRHQDQRQVGRDDVEQAHRPGAAATGSGPAQQVDRRRPRSRRSTARCGHRAPSSANRRCAAARRSGPTATSSRSQNSRAAPWPPRPRSRGAATRAHLGVRVRRRAGERGAAQQRQVGPVVAHRGDARPSRGRAPRASAVGRRAACRRRRRRACSDAEVGHAPPHRRRIAAGDDDRHDAGLRRAASGRGRRGSRTP